MSSRRIASSSPPPPPSLSPSAAGSSPDAARLRRATRFGPAVFAADDLKPRAFAPGEELARPPRSRRTALSGAHPAACTAGLHRAAWGDDTVQCSVCRGPMRFVWLSTATAHATMASHRSIIVSARQSFYSAGDNITDQSRRAEHSYK